MRAGSGGAGGGSGGGGGIGRILCGKGSFVLGRQAGGRVEMAPSSRADKYHIAELLGKGSFGTAHVVIDKETRKK